MCFLFTFWIFVCFSYLQMVTQGYPQYEIAGVGFDATCSMVAIDTDNNPLTVSTTGEFDAPIAISILCHNSR